MKKLNITPGKVYVTSSDPEFVNYTIEREQDMATICTMGIDMSTEEELDTATLYADAHNTYHVTGILPSEMAERIKALEALVERFAEVYESAASDKPALDRYDRLAIEARALLTPINEAHASIITKPE